jgi:excinuclease ABC subunit A
MAKAKKASATEAISNNDFIEVFGAREHNLKNIDIKIPKNQLVVFTGVSGSGKSSLAFDTIYNEGQRRWVIWNGLMLIRSLVFHP